MKIVITLITSDINLYYNHMVKGGVDEFIFNINTSNARRYDSLDPRLNIIESRFSLNLAS